MLIKPAFPVLARSAALERLSSVAASSEPLVLFSVKARLWCPLGMGSFIVRSLYQNGSLSTRLAVGARKSRCVCVGDTQQSTRYIGYAGGKSLFGLMGEVAAAVQAVYSDVRSWEVTTFYLSRQELLMLHHYDYGELPPDNPPPAAITLGKLRPVG